MLKSKNKILIVDDDMDILTVMTILLKKKGYEVEGTLNGEETIIRTEKFKPDLIIMDIYLSDTNGKDICRKLKDSKETKKIPVILISANAQFEKNMNECGANSFLNKPFEIPRLLGEVNGCLKKSVN